MRGQSTLLFYILFSILKFINVTPNQFTYLYSLYLVKCNIFPQMTLGLFNIVIIIIVLWNFLYPLVLTNFRILVDKTFICALIINTACMCLVLFSSLWTPSLFQSHENKFSEWEIFSELTSVSWLMEIST